MFICRHLRFRNNESQILVPSVFRLEKYYNIYFWVPELAPSCNARHVMRNRKEVFFPAAGCLRCCGRLLQKEIITPFPTVQSNYFSRLRDPIRNTKKYDKCHFLQRFRWTCKNRTRVFRRRETATLKSEHSCKNVNSFITRWIHFVTFALSQLVLYKI